MTKQSQPTPSDYDALCKTPFNATTLKKLRRIAKRGEPVSSRFLATIDARDKVIEQQAAELVAERMARAVLRNTIEQQASALKAVEADRVEIARLRGIEERLYAWCDKWGKTVYRKSSADDILRILEGDGKVSEPDACHEEMQ